MGWQSLTQDNRLMQRSRNVKNDWRSEVPFPVATIQYTMIYTSVATTQTSRLSDKLWFCRIICSPNFPICIQWNLQPNPNELTRVRYVSQWIICVSVTLEVKRSLGNVGAKISRSMKIIKKAKGIRLEKREKSAVWVCPQMRVFRNTTLLFALILSLSFLFSAFGLSETGGGFCGEEEEKKSNLIEMATLGGIRDSHASSQNSDEIHNLAKFAVDEHNKKEVSFPK